MRFGDDLVLGRRRALGTVALVGAITGFYAAVVIMMSTVLATGSDHSLGGVSSLLATASTVFILIAVYVGTIVIANGIDTVIAGRLHEIATLRLLGARSIQLRRAIARTTGVAGGSGAVVGALIGTVVAIVIRRAMVDRGALLVAPYPRFSVWIPVAVATVVGSCVFAGWQASRAVLDVAPSRALQRAEAPSSGTERRNAGLAVTLIFGGALVLGVAMRLGESAPAAGFVAAFLGAAVSGAGLLVGASAIIPYVVSLCGRLTGRSAAADIARRNAVADPRRTTRSTMGLTIGVTLVTTIAAGMQALQRAVGSWDLDARQRRAADELLRTATNVLVVVITVSGVIAVVGFVSTMSLTVVQRRRELGLLRALGLTRRQVRSMIAKESSALLAAAVTLGMVLGVLYGSIGAQSITGFTTDGFVWGVPWRLLGSIAAVSVIVTLVASQPPARRAVAVAPIAALRVD